VIEAVAAHNLGLCGSR